MEDKKKSITYFIKYVSDNNLASSRVLSMLKMTDGFIYDSFLEKMIEDITEIEDRTLLRVRNFGHKSIAEFRRLRTYYLQNIHSITFDDIAREEFKCWLRPDINRTLKTIKDERDFIEAALLEKFEREGIKLVEEKNETT